MTPPLLVVVLLVLLVQVLPADGVAGGYQASDGGSGGGPQAGFGATGEAALPTITHLLSLLGRLHLQLGNLVAAGAAFERLEALLRSPDESPAVRLNRGMLLLANSQYSDALIDFEAALKLEPTSVLAANNTAVCQLYW